MKRRILVVTPRFPYPVIGGDRLRIYEICKALSDRFDLGLLSLCESSQEMNLQPPNDGVFTEIRRVLLPRWKSWMNCASALMKGTSLQVAYYQSSQFNQEVVEMAERYDGIVAHLIRTASAVKALNKVKVLEMTDTISLNYNRVRANSSFFNWKGWVYGIEAPRVRAFEQMIVQHFDCSVLVSEVDRRFLVEGSSNARARILICPNGVDLDRFSFAPPVRGRDICFIGNMSSLQNLDAVWFFAERVLPILRKRLPGIKLRVLGRISEKNKRQLQKFSDLYVSGEIPSIQEAVRGSSVGICPVRMAAGVQFKLLEYMAMGIPAVATSVGLEGLGAKAEKELLVADDPNDFAVCIERLMMDHALADRIAIAARSYVEREHAWGRALAPMVSFFDESLRNNEQDKPQ